MNASNVLKNWSAKRAGGRITLTGVDETGAPRKIVGIDTISSLNGKAPVATHRSGDIYILK